MNADAIASRFIDDIIARTCNVGNVHSEVREDLYREVGALITAVSRYEVAKALFRADFKQWQHTLADDRFAVALLEAIIQRFEQRFQ